MEEEGHAPVEVRSAADGTRRRPTPGTGWGMGVRLRERGTAATAKLKRSRAFSGRAVGLRQSTILLLNVFFLFFGAFLQVFWWNTYLGVSVFVLDFVLFPYLNTGVLRSKKKVCIGDRRRTRVGA